MAPDVAAFLRRVPFFSSLPHEARAEVALELEHVTLENGEVLLRQGDPGDCLYVVFDGRLEARYENPTSGLRVLGSTGRGGLLGEESVLTGRPRSATVVAVRESVVLRLGKDEFKRIAEQQPQAVLALAREVILRAQASRDPSAPVKTIALVPAGPDVDLRDFARRLTAALPHAAIVGWPEVTHALGTVVREPSWPRSPTVLDWLSRQENDSEIVFYEADSEQQDWSRCCVRHADRILLVGHATGGATPSQFEKTLLGPGQPLTQAPIELVLLHPNRSRLPSGTVRWLEPRQIRMHHHVALDTPRDFERVGRILSGRAISLVLSGGGANAFTEIGIVRTLEQEGIPIDVVGGTSMGAVIGSLVAMGQDAATIQENLRREVAWRGMRDLTLPLASLCAGEKGVQAMQGLVGSLCIEDLWLNFFAVSADLVSGEEVVLRRGPLAEAGNATAAVPAMFPPLKSGDRWLVDGAVLNNLPVDVMSQLVEGRIVAVDASRWYGFGMEVKEQPPKSGWRLLWQRLNPFQQTPKAPSIFHVWARSRELSSWRISRATIAQLPDVLLIQPDVPYVGLMDFDAIDALVERGAAYGAAHVAEWKKELSLERSDPPAEDAELARTGTAG